MGWGPSGGAISDDAIVAELMTLAERHPGYALLQFRAVASAHQYRHLYRLVREFVPAGAEVLDWGAGNGHFSYFLLRAAYRATGYSLEEVSFLAASARDDYRFVKGDRDEPVRLPFEDGSFDAVASVGVLEHVPESGGDERASLAEIVRVLKAGGIFVCYHLPNRYSWIDRAARAGPWGPHHHQHRYAAEDIERLTAATGLELLTTRTYGALPRNFWHRLPAGLRASRAAALAWDRLDDLLSSVLAPICQNRWFVARRRSENAR